jgi:hypothetical protein
LKPSDVKPARSGRYKVFVAHPEGGDPVDHHAVSRTRALQLVRVAIRNKRAVEVLDDLDPVELFAWDPEEVKG